MTSAHSCPDCGRLIADPSPFRLGNVVVDGLRVRLNGREVALAHTQFLIAETLIRANGRHLTRGYLASAIGGEFFDEAICQYIRRTREAFVAIDGNFDQIETLHGFGAYRWRREPKHRGIMRASATETGLLHLPATTRRH